MENDENELKLNISDNNNPPSSINIFKPDYNSQNYENNTKFIKWKKLMLEKNGPESLFYTCSYDNIIFCPILDYQNKKDLKSPCPICKNDICFFCKKTFKRDHANCCLRQIFRYMHKDGIRLLNSEQDKIENYDKKSFYFFLIPCINFIFLINFFYNVLFYKLVFINEKDDDYEKRYMDVFYMNGHQHEALFVFNVIVNALTSFLLLIPFFVYDIGISFICLILSAFPKSPYTYFIGFINNEWNYLFGHLRDEVLYR